MVADPHLRIQEVEAIEADDQHHDFGGPHGSKGHDFAHFWMIVRITELEKAGQDDYMFVCEYVQDVAEFDSSVAPLKLTLYQLKKKEDGYWTPTNLTGQTKSDRAKTPKPDKPLPKLFRSVRTFKTLKARGAFISNAAFDVSLSSGERSVNSEVVCLASWDAMHAEPLKAGLATMEGIKPDDVDLSTLELRRVALSLDDLQRHVNGIVLDFLQQVAPEHIAQAPSLVDSLYVRIKATARRTEKCPSWAQLVERRGFGKLAFQRAVESLKAIPDKVSHRERVLGQLSKNWNTRREARVRAALLRCAREKVLLGEANRWRFDRETLRGTCHLADEQDLSDEAWFEQMRVTLAAQVPDLSDDELSALAIYEMTEWTLSQIPA